MFTPFDPFKAKHCLCVVFFILAAIILACSKPVSQMEQLGSKLPEPPAGFAWQLVSEFSDEFNGSALDTSKWLDHRKTFLCGTAI